jgi:hypothetical protein
MKSINTILFCISMILCSGCIEYKLIPKGNYLTKVTTNAQVAGNPTETVFYVKHGVFGKIDNKVDYLIISDVNSGGLEKPTPNVVATTTGAFPVSDFRAGIDGKYYNSQKPIDNAPANVSEFKYITLQPVLQGLTTVVKVRPRLGSYAVRDSFPSQTETGFSPSLALGLKLSTNTFKTSKDIFGKNIRQISVTPGVFFGVGGVDLTKSNTRAPKIVYPRRALFLSRGGFITFGYNNINLGYAWGKDYATGEQSSGWLYKNETWHGIIFGFDIIK